MRKRKAILGVGVGAGGEFEARAALRKSARSSSSSGRDIGTLRGGRIRGAKRKRSGKERRSANERTKGVENMVLENWDFSLSRIVIEEMGFRCSNRFDLREHVADFEFPIEIGRK